MFRRLKNQYSSLSMRRIELRTRRKDGRTHFSSLGQVFWCLAVPLTEAERVELERIYVAREKAMGNLGHPGRDVQKGVARGLELSGMSLGWWCQAYWSISRQRLSREEGGARTHGIYFLYRLGSREEAKYTSCLDSLHPLVWLSRDHRIFFLWRLAGSHEGLPYPLSWMPTSFS